MIYAHRRHKFTLEKVHTNILHLGLEWLFFSLAHSPSIYHRCFIGYPYVLTGFAVAGVRTSGTSHFTIGQNLSFPKLQRLPRWGLGMDTKFQHILYNGCNHSPMQRSELSHVSKMCLSCLRLPVNENQALRNYVVDIFMSGFSAFNCL